MLNRGTLLLLVSAIALGGSVLLFENRGEVSDRLERAEEAQGEPLLPFEESAIAQFTLERPNEDDLSFIKDESEIWQMSAPEEKIAEEGAIAFLLSQLTRPSNRIITMNGNSLEDFGLDNPAATIAIETKESTYQILVGSADFGGDQRYVQVIDVTSEPNDAISGESEAEPPTPDEADTSQEIEIHLVSGGIINAIERPTAEWLVAEETETNASQSKPNRSETVTGESDKNESQNDQLENGETASDEAATD